MGKFIQLDSPATDWNWLDFVDNPLGIPVISITCTGGEGEGSKYFLADKEDDRQIVIFPDILIPPGKSETVYYFGTFIKLCFIRGLSVINSKSRIIMALK